MSSIGYGGLLYQVSQKIQKLADLSKINQLFYTCRKAGLIDEDSESYNVQVNPGDNIAVIVMKLFSDLEEQDNLGIDNLEILRDLLKGVKEWSLIDEVDKFERQRQDFNTLLEQIIPKLDELGNLEQLISLCADHISEDVKDDITDVGSLFKELDKKKRLGVGRLAILKMILKGTGEQELLDALMEFEKKWKKEEVSERRKDRAADVVNTMIVAPAAALHSTVKHTWEQMIGAVKILCSFSTVSGLSLAVGTGIILSQGSGVSLREFADAFRDTILPAATQLRTLSESSVCFTVQAENRPALEALWKRYQDGILQRSLQEFLVTDDIKQLADGEEVILTAHIDEQDYNNACLSFIIAEKQVLDKADQDMPLKRARRHSDSILYARTKENESTLVQLKLRQEEIKFHQEKIESLEKEIKSLKAQIEEEASDRHKESTPAGEAEYPSWRRDKEIQEKLGIKRFRSATTSDLEIVKIRGKEFEGMERPRKRPRRNSDSSLYCKARVEEIQEREKKQEQLLGDEKYAFVQRYLEEAHETHSVITSDSGHVTHGAPSELGMEDIHDDTQKLCFNDLAKDVTSELETRLECDEDAVERIIQSFGITGPFHLIGKIGNILNFFPNTPVKLLKDVFEALQLYDLLDLLEKPTTKLLPSLRPALTLNDIKKLRNTANRPTTYHNCAAVLIYTLSEKVSHVRDLEKFFTDIDTKSEVTIITTRFWWKMYNEQSNVQYEMLQQEKMIESIASRMQSLNAPKQGQHVKSEMQQQQTAMELTRELKSRRQTVEQLETRLKEIEEEKEGNGQAILAVIDRWIQCQDDFSFFAVFNFTPYSQFIPDRFSFPEVISKLEVGIPDKTKFLVGDDSTPKKLPQALGVTCPLDLNELLSLLLEILNKRWQTLDLISMMSEFKRSAHERSSKVMWRISPVTITDTLSSLPRFKRSEDLKCL